MPFPYIVRHNQQAGARDPLPDPMPVMHNLPTRSIIPNHNPSFSQRNFQLSSGLVSGPLLPLIMPLQLDESLPERKNNQIWGDQPKQSNIHALQLRDR
jgi:hypothetical protein